jgi:hypothetical protein
LSSTWTCCPCGTPWRGCFGWRVVLFDDGDALEVVGEDARGDEAGHPGAQDDRPVSTGAEVSS